VLNLIFKGVYPALRLTRTVPEVRFPYLALGTPVITSTLSILEVGMFLKSTPELAVDFTPAVELAGFSACILASLLIGIPSIKTDVPKELTLDPPSSAERSWICWLLVKSGAVTLLPGSKDTMSDKEKVWTCLIASVPMCVLLVPSLLSRRFAVTTTSFTDRLAYCIFITTTLLCFSFDIVISLVIYPKLVAFNVVSFKGNFLNLKKPEPSPMLYNSEFSICTVTKGIGLFVSASKTIPVST